MSDDKMTVSPVVFRHHTVGGMNRAQCLHKYIQGYDIRLAPTFDSEVYETFDIYGDKPWEIAVASGIDRARGPIDRIDVDPARVVIIYRSRTNITADVISWEDTRTSTERVVHNTMRWLLSRISKFSETDFQLKAPAELTRIIMGETVEDLDAE